MKSDSWGSRLTWKCSGRQGAAGNFQAILAREKRLGITKDHAALFFAPGHLGQAAARSVHGGAAVAGIQGGGNLQRLAGLEVAPDDGRIRSSTRAIRGP